MRTKLVLLTLFISTLSFGQNSELFIFDNLVSKTWKAEGEWGDGTKFIQEIEIKYSLDKTLVIMESIGFVDKAQTKLGPRNHGIRQFDKETKTIKFWEFDVFGGLTQGTVFAEGKNIVYQYKYGNSVVTDMWEYVDDATYNFKVGSYENGEWKQVYLSTKFVEQEADEIEITGQLFLYEFRYEIPYIMARISIAESNDITKSDFDGKFKISLPKEKPTLDIIIDLNITDDKLDKKTTYRELKIIITDIEIPRNGKIELGKIGLPEYKSITIEEFDQLTRKEKRDCKANAHYANILGYEYAKELSSKTILLNCKNGKRISEFDFNPKEKTITVRWEVLKNCQ